MADPKTHPRVWLSLAYMEYHLSRALAKSEIDENFEAQQEFVVHRGGIGSSPHIDTFAITVTVRKKYES